MLRTQHRSFHFSRTKRLSVCLPIDRPGNLDMHINTIQQRSRNAFTVLGYPIRTAGAAGQRRLGSEIAARTRIHRNGKQKIRRKGKCRPRPANRYLPFLQRLTQHLQRPPGKLGKLIEKQYAVMRQANLSWFRYAAASNQASGRYRMMRGAKRSTAD
ncbi:hypothetical protein D3C77_498030 [compost metagenome]